MAHAVAFGDTRTPISSHWRAALGHLLGSFKVDALRRCAEGTTPTDSSAANRRCTQEITTPFDASFAHHRGRIATLEQPFHQAKGREQIDEPKQ